MVKLATIITEYSIFGASVSVKFFAPDGKKGYKKYEKAGFNDVFSAEKFAFQKNSELLRSKLIGWKDNLIYLTKYGYLNGKARENAQMAFGTINKYLYEMSKINLSREDIIKSLDVIAYAVQCSRPHPHSARMKQYGELVALLEKYMEQYKIPETCA